VRQARAARWELRRGGLQTEADGSRSEPGAGRRAGVWPARAARWERRREGRQTEADVSRGGELGCGGRVRPNGNDNGEGVGRGDNCIFGTLNIALRTNAIRKIFFVKIEL
jgi:hypothetical protein